MKKEKKLLILFTIIALIGPLKLLINTIFSSYPLETFIYSDILGLDSYELGGTFSHKLWGIAGLITLIFGVLLYNDFLKNKIEKIIIFIGILINLPLILLMLLELSSPYIRIG